MSNENDLREIPGSYGPPVVGLLGQTLEFRRHWKRYFDSRRDRYGNVFKTHIGVKAIAILEQQAAQPLFDASIVRKRFGFGPAVPVRRRLGDVVPTVFTNDEEHVRQKTFLLDLMRRNVPSMVATFDRVVEPYFERWERQQTFDWRPECDGVISDFMFEWLLGGGPDSADLSFWTSHLLPEFGVEIPFLRNRKVLRTYERILARVKAAPRFHEVAAAAQEITGWDEETAARQLLFSIGFNASAGTRGALHSVVAEMTLNPAIRQATAEEIRQTLGSDGTLDFKKLGELHGLENVVRETLRLHQPVSLFYAEARDDLVLHARAASHQVRRGELLLGVMPYIHRDPEVFDDPDSFRPDRFAKGSAASCVLWSHGPDTGAPQPDNKMCAGKDVAELVLKMFCIKLLPHYHWTLEQLPRWSDDVLDPANRPLTPFTVSSFERTTNG